MIEIKGVKRCDRDMFDYFYNQAKAHKIGDWHWLWDIECNNTYYGVFILSYYCYYEPNFIVVENGIKNIFQFYIKDLVPLDENYDIDVINNIKITLKNKIKYLNKTEEYFIDYWKTYNINYSKYRKIWRKYKNGWYKNRKVNYKSVPFEFYYHWQVEDKWFYSTKEIREMKSKGIELTENLEYPNFTEFIYDNAEPTGFWG